MWRFQWKNTNNLPQTAIAEMQHTSNAKRKLVNDIRRLNGLIAGFN